MMEIDDYLSQSCSTIELIFSHEIVGSLSHLVDELNTKYGYLFCVAQRYQR